MNNEKTIECLNDLLTKSYDAEEGFKKAAERATGHPDLARFFKNQSYMRLTFGHEIKAAITQYGGVPDKGSSIAAKAHQVWIAVKDSLTAEDDGEAILEECVRGEQAALADYDDKLNRQDLPPDVRDLISKQRASVANSLSTTKAMEKAAD